MPPRSARRTRRTPARALGSGQRAQRRHGVDVLPGGAQARGTVSPAGLLDVGAEVDSSAPHAGTMPASISSAAVRRPRRDDQRPASAGPSTNVAENARLMRGVGLLLGAPAHLPRRSRANHRFARPRLDARRSRGLGAQQRARRQRRRAVERHQHQHDRQREVPQRATASAIVTAPSNTYRALSSPRRGEASTRATTAGTRNAGTPGGDQQRSDRERAVGVIEHGQRQRDDAEPGAEPVDRVRRDDPAQRASARQDACAPPMHANELSARPCAAAHVRPVRPAGIGRSCGATVPAWRRRPE